VLAYVTPSVHPARRAPQSANLFRFTEIRSIDSKGKNVRVNGQLLLRTGSPTLASYLAGWLRHLNQLPAAKRAHAIKEFFESSLDTNSVHDRWAEFRQHITPVRLLTNLLFGYLFFVAPALIWRFGLSNIWPWLLLGILGCTMPISVLFHRAHKRLYSAAEDERFTQFLVILLSPATAIRTHDFLSRS